MLDLLGIIVSTVAILFVMFRAVQLDSKLPWFAQVKPSGNPTDDKSGRTPPEPTWRSRGR